MTNGTILDVLETGEGDHPAVVVPGGPRLTYDQLREQVRRGVEMLSGLGLGPQDRIAMALPNGAEALVVFLVAAGTGAAAPLNSAYKEDEFRFYLEDTKARALIVSPGQGEAARRALPEGALLIEAEIGADGVLRMEAVSGRADGNGSEGPTADDVALVLHTSGTTSRPKIVPLRHRNLLASTGNISATYQLTPEDVSLCVMPLFHVHGLLASSLSTLRTGGTVVIPTRFNPLNFWTIAAEHGATWYSAVPTIHQMLLMRADRSRPEANLRFIRSCSSALAPETMRELEERFGAPVLEAYGMTEASHQIASNPLPPDDRRPGSVGRGTGVEVGTMDGEGNLLPPGSRGEVVIRGPNVTTGYEANPEANASAFTDGWFRTGDEGVVDDRGYVTLISRIKELINRGGEKIAPREVEEVVLLHPAVEEAVAFGVPHDTWGEEVGVAVVLREPVPERDLIAYCRERLADFKVPKKLFITEQIPRTATGKVQRRFVAAAFTEPAG